VTDLISAYTNPEKYAVSIPIHCVMSDEKVDEEYVRSIANVMRGDCFRPIVVIKHPSKDLYAVLDGHHRLAASRLKGAETIMAVIVDDYTGLGFELTRIGAFQPTPLFTRHVRLPIKRLTKYLQSFLKDPERFLGE
jgi:predicted ATPase